MRYTETGPLGYYYDEVAIGQKMTTRGRTITEADIIAFGSLTGDFNPMHFDDEYMKKHMLGRRVAHGMLTVSYAVGQIYQLGHIERTTLAFRGLEVKFSAPVFIGDTIHIETEVTEKKDARRLGGGMVTSAFKIVKQDGTVVQSGTMTILLASKPDGG